MPDDPPDPSRRELLQAAALTAAAVVLPALPACAPRRERPSADDPVSLLRAFAVPPGTEPAAVFAARRPESAR